MTSTATARRRRRAARACCRPSADDAAHGGYIAGGINASYTDIGGAGGTPPLTTNAQHVVQLARQHVEYVQAAAGIQFSGVQAPETDPLGGLQAANQLDPGDWMLLNNRYELDGVSNITARFASNAAANSLRGTWTSGSTRSTAPWPPRASCGRPVATASTGT